MRFAVAAILTLVSFVLKAETSYVAFVKGTILKTGRPVKTGDTLDVSKNIALEFSTPNDLIVVVVPNRGRYVIKAKNIRQSQNKLWVLIKENLVPCTQRNALTARAPGQSLDLTEFLKGGRLAVVERTLIPIDKSFWIDRDSNYFYLTYNLKTESVTKKLPFQEPVRAEDTLKIVMDENIFVVNGARIPSGDVADMTLYFYEKSVPQSIKIKDLKIVLLTDPAVLNQIKGTYLLIQKHLYRDLPSLEGELKAHIEEFYGKIDHASVSALINQINAPSN